MLVVGLSFGFTQFFWSNHVDSNLVDIMAGAVSIVATVAFLHFWKPKRVWRFDYDKKETPLPANRQITDQAGGEWAAKEFDGYGSDHDRVRSYPVGQVLKAWMPFAILSLFVLLWGLPKIKLAINQATTPAFKVVLPDGKLRPGPPGWDVPLLHNAVYRAAPVVTKPTPEAARYDFNWLSATGTGCLLSAILSGLLLGMSPLRLARTFWRTLVRMRLAVVAISFMLGLGYVTRYSGLDAVLGLAFTRTGWAYPFFGAFLGWLGVALTGSDTSSNALFGSLQRITVPATRDRSGSNVRGQQRGWRDGQNGGRAVDHDSHRRHRTGRERRHDIPIRGLAFGCPGMPSSESSSCCTPTCFPTWCRMD